MDATRNATASRQRPAGSKPRTASAIVLLLLEICHTPMPLEAAAAGEGPAGDREGVLAQGESAPSLPPLPDGLEPSHRDEPPDSNGSLDPNEPPYWKRNLFSRLITDQKFLATRWWGRELRRFDFALPLAIGAILAAPRDGGRPGLDERLGRSWRRNLAGPDDRVAMGLSRVGDARTAMALVGGAYLLSRWSGNERLARSSSLAAEALLDAGLWNIALKRLARRTRPAGGGHGDFFADRPLQGQSTGSFPSGHAMGAFAVATVLAEEYRDRRWVPWVAYTTAGLIGGSRLSLERHFPSDIMVGALLGHSIGKMVAARQRGDGGETTSRFEPAFLPGGEGYGIMFVRTW